MNRRGALITAFLLAVSSLMAGCANTPLDAQAKAAMRTVAISKQIDLIERPTVFGDKAGGAFLLGGLVGTAIDQKASNLPDQLVQLLAAQRIDMRELARAALRDQLAAKGFTVIDDEALADAVLKVNIGAYGLTGDILSGEGKRFPLLSIRADLVKRGADSAVWRSVVSSNVEEAINKQLDARPLQDYYTDPALLRREYEKINRLVAQRLTRTL
jgi:hypothetical protein